jgi:hypothetical protein
MGVTPLGFPKMPCHALVTWQEGYCMKNQTIAIERPPTRRQLKVLLKALLRVRQAPELRSHKLQPLTATVRTNTYRVDCRKLADCLIASLLLGYC